MTIPPLRQTCQLIFGLLVLSFWGCASAVQRNDCVHISTAAQLSPEAAADTLRNSETATPFEAGHFGHDRLSHWILCEACGETGQRWILEINNPNIDSVDVYQLAPSLTPQQIGSGGELNLPGWGFEVNRRPILAASSPPGEGCTAFLVHIRNRSGSLTIPLELYPHREFWEREHNLNLVHGAIFGLFLFVILAGLMMAHFLRRPMFAAYSLYASVQALFSFSYSGFWSLWLSHVHPEANVAVKLAASLMLFPTFSLFTRSYFALDQISPRWNRWFKWLTLPYYANIGYGVLILVFNWSEHAFFLGLSYLMGAAVLVSVVLLIRDMWKVRPRATRYFAHAMGMQGVVLLLFLMQEIGWVNLLSVGVSPLIWASAMEMGILMFGAVVVLVNQLKQAESAKVQAYVEGLEEEKRRVASELHDDVLSHLVLIQSQLLCNKPFEEELRQVSDQIRGIAQSLHPVTFEHQSLPDRLRSLAASHQAQGLLVHLYCHEVTDALDKRMQFELFRIAQEALANVRKHAEAKNVYVNLIGSDGGKRLNLTIEDDGRGFEITPQNPGRLGLRNIAHRVEVLGAQWELQSTPGKGTLIAIECRWDGKP